MEEMEETDPSDKEYEKMEGFKDCSLSYVNNGNFSWIWRNGVNLGKKIVVTGVVVSSASCVLPPLVALSAIGLALSLPAGFLCVSYICGERLLNTLLPMPSSPSYEENELTYSDNKSEEYRVFGDDVEEGYVEDEDVDVEEKVFEEDTRKEIEMRIELAKENNKKTNDHDQISADKGELDKISSIVSETVEEGGYEEDVGEYMEEEEQPLDSIMIPKILEGIREAENEVSLMEKEEGGMPRDSLRAVVLEAQLSGEIENNVQPVMEDMAFVGGENEINVELVGGYEEDVGEHIEDEEQSVNSRTPSQIINKIKEVENEIPLTVKEEDGITRDSSKAIVVEAQVGRENENNIEHVRENLSFEGGENENNVGQVEDYEEDVGEHMEEEEQPLDSIMISKILEGIREAENEVSLMEKEEGGMPRDSLRAVILEAQVNGEDENNAEPVMEDMIFVPPRDIAEENGYAENVAGLEEDGLRGETTGLIEKMRDEGKDDLKRKDRPVKETLEDNEESGSVSVNDVSDNMGNKNLTIIPEEPEPAVDDKGVIGGLKSDADLDNISIEGDEFGLVHEEPKSAVGNQLLVNVKIDGGHTVTEVHQGTFSDKLGPLLLSNEASVIADGSGCNLSDNGTVEPDQNADSIDKMPEDDDLSSNNEVEVTVEYHEVVIESLVPVSAPDHGTAACSDKVQMDEEKIWEQINAMRTIVGYKDTPHPSCAEELKALYVFTGVEPPASSKNPVDLADINEKLRFLMSVVGVK